MAMTPLLFTFLIDEFLISVVSVLKNKLRLQLHFQISRLALRTAMIHICYAKIKVLYLFDRYYE